MFNLKLIIVPFVFFAIPGLAETLKPNQKFILFAANVSAPASIGWQLDEKSDTKVTFTYKHDESLRTAQVAFFTFPPPHDKASLLNATKKNIAALTSVGGAFVAEPKFEYTNIQKNPCVKSSFSVKYVATIQGSPVEKILFFQYRILTCQIPLYENTGLMIGYSYSGENKNEVLEREADSFIAGIKVQEK